GEGCVESRRMRSKLIQGDATWTELLPVTGVYVAVPEMLTEAKARGEAEDDIGVGTCLTRRLNNRLPKLNARLRLRADVKSDLESLAFEARRDGYYNIRKRGRGRHEQISMGIVI